MLKVVDPPPDSTSRSTTSFPPLKLRMSLPQFIPFLKCRCSFVPSQCAQVFKALGSPAGVTVCLSSSV